MTFKKKINLQMRSFGTTNILLTLSNSKKRDPVECRDSEFERKSSLSHKRLPEAGVSRGGGPGACTPQEIVKFRECDFPHSEGQVN